MRQLLSRLFSSKPVAGLPKPELELIGLLRLAPSEPLNGSDLTLANAMVTRGLLRTAGPRRYLLTEKAMVAYRTARR